MMGPDYANILSQIAERAAETTRWYEDFELWAPDGVWFTPAGPAAVFRALEAINPIRRKPRTVTITGPGGQFSYPEPMREAPEYGTQYNVVNFLADDPCSYWYWMDDKTDLRVLARGLAHNTPEAVYQNVRAWILASGGSLDDE